ncbi:MAG: type II toxin-antitoxin system prevent-host-death family antitoxin [Acetobacteraceae bacterium]
MAQLIARDSTMKSMSAREPNNILGLMIDIARAEPVLIEKHGRGIVAVIAVEEYERLNGAANAAPSHVAALRICARFGNCEVIRSPRRRAAASKGASQVQATRRLGLLLIGR